MLSRRSFLASTLPSSGLFALSATTPEFLVRTARAAPPRTDSTILVVVQLSGGNDGINTVIPIADEGYAKHRRTLRIPKDRVLGVTKEVGLHPTMTELAKLVELGQCAIVQGVGYPNPSRSHFESMAIWHSARRDKDQRNNLGWLGRAFDGQPTASAYSVQVGGTELPLALRGRRAIASGLTRPEDFVLNSSANPEPTLGTGDANADLQAFVRRYAVDATVTAKRMEKVIASSTKSASYPSSQLGADLKLISRLMKADTATRVFYANQPGYDTHATQYGTHQQLLSRLSEALGAFWKDLQASRLSERVLVLVFSEFGRTVRENGSAGTDHGTAAPVFVLASKVCSGTVGSTPSLTDLDPKHGDLRSNVDFRQVYATVLQDWLGIPSKPAVGGDFERLALFAD